MISDKELSEFIAGFLNLPQTHRTDFMWILDLSPLSSLHIDTESMFRGEAVSAIIRHLIEEEMVARGYAIGFQKSSRDEECLADFYNPTIEGALGHGQCEDKNKTRAIALAAWRTGER